MDSCLTSPVAAGFDAAEGDQLGGCFVTPACYAHMTHMLMSLAGGRVVACLEVRHINDTEVIGLKIDPLGWLQPQIDIKISSGSLSNSRGGISGSFDQLCADTLRRSGRPKSQALHLKILALLTPKKAW